jgi:predicted ATP-binding protein involved in virulence
VELVYLWVEKYKNIKRQGFNFSPRFECKYENDELTICDKKKNECKDNNYIENFFGNNINITAIVGKNGSGKSNIVRFLREFIDNKTDYHALVFYYNKDNETFFYQSSNEITIVNSSLEIEKIKCLKYTSFPLFDYSLTINNDDSFLWKPIFPRKYEDNINTISLDKESRRNVKNIIKNYLYLEKDKQLDKFKDFFIPTKILLNINFNDFKEKFYATTIEKLIDELEKIDDEYSLISSLKYVKQKYGNQKLKETKNRNIYTIFESNIKDLTYSQEEAYENTHSNGFNKYEKSSVREIFDECIDKSTLISIDLKDKEKLLTELSFGEQQLLYILNQIYTLATTYHIHRMGEPTEEYCDKGEKGFNEQESFDETEMYEANIKNFIIFFDEIDIGFHPNWQKKTIQYIIDFLELVPNKKFHLIFTTHSPFLLSDIPKENIIFLDKYKKDEDNNQEEGNCKVVDGLTQTFGANIHTLLSDSFFMKDGLMGEFAKSKINEIIKNLKDKDYSPSEKEERQVYLTIKSIGEPFLKQKLSKMYFDKFDTKKQDRIKELKAELKRLENG